MSRGAAADLPAHPDGGFVPFPDAVPAAPRPAELAGIPGSALRSAA